MKKWKDKPYHSFDYFLKEKFQQKVYKISLDAGMTCPNRDGTLGVNGCIFCSEGGSGDFAGDRTESITKQIEKGKLLVKNKIENGKYIAYFQAFTNTYAPISYLEKIYKEAVNHPDIIALSIGTRPDCLPKKVLDLLQKINKIKPVFIELGLQTIHEDTAELIHRGYKLPVFTEAVKELNKRDIDCIVHVILGLPGEKENEILETIRYLNKLPIQGIKLSLLHILKNTALYDLYEKHPEQFYYLGFDEYIKLVILCIENLRPEIVIHRITGDGPKDLLVAPLWSLNKRKVLNTIHKQMALSGAYQGRKESFYASGNPDAL